MQELVPGIHHWTAFRETIGQPVHSAYVATARTLIDPMVPEGGLRAFGGELPEPERIVLTNRHHRRHSARFVERFHCEVLVNSRGVWELQDAPLRVRGFEPGDELAPGIVAQEVGVLCPDESALHVTVGPGALAVADGVVREGGDGELGFVSERLLGDDPVGIRRGLAAAYGRLADELEFDVLLLAHGAPIVGGAREALRDFAVRWADG